jgi:hypothetical protein
MKPIISTFMFLAASSAFASGVTTAHREADVHGGLEVRYVFSATCVYNVGTETTVDAKWRFAYDDDVAWEDVTFEESQVFLFTLKHPKNMEPTPLSLQFVETIDGEPMDHQLVGTMKYLRPAACNDSIETYRFAATDGGMGLIHDEQ